MDEQNTLMLISHLLLIVALAVRPSPRRWLFFLPILFGALYTIFFTTSANATTDYVMGGMAFGLLVKSSDFILLTDVQRELRRKDQPSLPFTYSLPRRLRWAIDLFFSARLVGWNAERPSVLPPQPRQKTRSSFVIYQLWRVFLELMIYDLAGLWNQYGPSFHIYHIIHPIFNVPDFVLPTAIGLSAQHRLYSIICVATGRWKPDDFPSWYGSWRDAYTLRKFWGQVQTQPNLAAIQLTYNTIVDHGTKECAAVLGLKAGGNPSAYVQLYTAFLISGLIHYACDRMALRNWSGGALQFFMGQAVAIHVEDIVLAIAQRLGVKERPAWRVLGYTWVWAWFAWRIPTWQGLILAMGYQEDSPKIKIIESVWSYLHASDPSN
ncbi:hypothetical protein HGRIS_000405 [Hohenbuehelia grisea]|uniref:Wax synthase domain-containing protein n=1 Tax=Hohenbuehelia grisea TaxID=104357 RepID=A0ABR3JRW2_9AGAR